MGLPLIIGVVLLALGGGTYYTSNELADYKNKIRDTNQVTEPLTDQLLRETCPSGKPFSTMQKRLRSGQLQPEANNILSYAWQATMNLFIGEGFQIPIPDPNTVQLRPVFQIYKTPIYWTHESHLPDTWLPIHEFPRYQRSLVTCALVQQNGQDEEPSVLFVAGNNPKIQREDVKFLPLENEREEQLSQEKPDQVASKSEIKTPHPSALIPPSTDMAPDCRMTEENVDVRSAGYHIKGSGSLTICPEQGKKVLTIEPLKPVVVNPEPPQQKKARPRTLGQNPALRK